MMTCLKPFGGLGVNIYQFISKGTLYSQFTSWSSIRQLFYMCIELHH